MTSSLYPEIRDDDDIDRLRRAFQEISRLRRDEDISDFQNLNNRFVLGRGLFQSRATPSSPSDVLATDEEGDYVSDATHEFKLLNISGTLLWDRRVLDTGW